VVAVPAPAGQPPAAIGRRSAPTPWEPASARHVAHVAMIITVVSLLWCSTVIAWLVVTH
jgi:hypothetical protein